MSARLIQSPLLINATRSLFQRHLTSKLTCQSRVFSQQHCLLQSKDDRRLNGRSMTDGLKRDHSLVNYLPSRGAASSTHNHSMLWSIERYLSASLLALIPGAFILPSLPMMDYALAMALCLHVHWGVEAIVVDYIRPALFGPLIPKMAILMVYLLSILSLGGLFYFNYTDVGITNAIRMAWKVL